MLRRIIGKGKIFSDHCNVGNFLLKCCSSLALWFFHIFSKVFNSEDFSGRIFFRRCRGSRPQEPQRRFRAQQVRRRRRRSGHGPSSACRIWLSGVLPKPFVYWLASETLFQQYTVIMSHLLRYAILTASLIYESQVRCQAHPLCGYPKTLYPPWRLFTPDDIRKWSRHAWWLTFHLLSNYSAI